MALEDLYQTAGLNAPLDATAIGIAGQVQQRRDMLNNFLMRQRLAQQQARFQQQQQLGNLHQQILQQQLDPRTNALFQLAKLSGPQAATEYGRSTGMFPNIRNPEENLFQGAAQELGVPLTQPTMAEASSTLLPALHQDVQKNIANLQAQGTQDPLAYLTGLRQYASTGRGQLAQHLGILNPTVMSQDYQKELESRRIYGQNAKTQADNMRAWWQAQLQQQNKAGFAWDERSGNWVPTTQADLGRGRLGERTVHDVAGEAAQTAANVQAANRLREAMNQRNQQLMIAQMRERGMDDRQIMALTGIVPTPQGRPSYGTPMMPGNAQPQGQTGTTPMMQVPPMGMQTPGMQPTQPSLGARGLSDKEAQAKAITDDRRSAQNDMIMWQQLNDRINRINSITLHGPGGFSNPVATIVGSLLGGGQTPGAPVSPNQALLKQLGDLKQQVEERIRARGIDPATGAKARATPPAPAGGGMQNLANQLKP